MLGLIDVVDLITGPDDRESGAGHAVLIDYAARWLSGEPTAGDDAAEARFWPFAEALALVEWNETRRIITLARERLG